MTRWLLVPFLLVGSLLSGCLVELENQIDADEEVDTHLVGVWVPVWRAPDEVVEESYRHSDDIGLNEYLIIGQSDDGALQIATIEAFKNSGPMSIGEFTARTRAHQNRTFLLLEMHPQEESLEPRKANFVLEYEFNEGGDLFLFYSYIETLEEMTVEHPIKWEATKGHFPGAVLKASPEELLNFFCDPEVAKLMTSVGKYRKMTLPPGNSPPTTEEPPE